MDSSCPCHSGLSYDLCCQPFHQGKPAPTPLALMRSRYSAYAIGLVDYILNTAATPGDRKGIQSFCEGTQFLGLQILETGESTVTFRAHLEQNGQDASFTEKSLFIKEGGRWLYHSGQIS